MKKEEYLKQIGVNLKKIRTDRGMSLNEVAKLLNLNKNSIANFENGNTDTSVYRLYQLSEIYKIHISEIFAENSPISAKIESIRNEMKEYQKKYEKAQEKHEKAQDTIIELQTKLSAKDRNSKYK